MPFLRCGEVGHTVADADEAGLVGGQRFRTPAVEVGKSLEMSLCTGGKQNGQELTGLGRDEFFAGGLVLHSYAGWRQVCMRAVTFCR